MPAASRSAEASAHDSAEESATTTAAADAGHRAPANHPVTHVSTGASAIKVMIVGLWANEACTPPLFHKLAVLVTGDAARFVNAVAALGRTVATGGKRQRHACQQAKGDV